MKIAVVDSDIRFAQAVQEELSASGYLCSMFLDWSIFSRNYESRNFDVSIVGGEGDVDVQREIKAWLNCRGANFVIVTKSSATGNDVADWLEAGASDFVLKPFQPKTLAMRIEALAKRVQLERQAKVFRFGNYILDPRRRSINCNGPEVSLTDKEFSLLLILFKNFGTVLDRDEIFNQVWGSDSSTTSRTVDTHVARVRKKMKTLPSREFSLMSVYGKGYMIVGHGGAEIAPALI